MRPIGESLLTVLRVDGAGLPPGHAALILVADTHNCPKREPPARTVGPEHVDQRDVNVRLGRHVPFARVKVHRHTTRDENAVNLWKYLFFVLSVLQHARTDDNIEDLVGERQSIWPITDDVHSLGVRGTLLPELLHVASRRGVPKSG